jgi:hypothetical protein
MHKFSSAVVAKSRQNFAKSSTIAKFLAAQDVAPTIPHCTIFMVQDEPSVDHRWWTVHPNKTKNEWRYNTPKKNNMMKKK